MPIALKFSKPTGYKRDILVFETNAPASYINTLKNRLIRERSDGSVWSVYKGKEYRLKYFNGVRGKRYAIILKDNENTIHFK